MANRFEAGAVKRISRFHRWQNDLLVFNGRVGVVRAFDIGPEEARKVNAFAGCLEYRIVGFNLNGDVGLTSIRHLSGDGALPNQIVKLQFALFEGRVLGCAKHFTRGTNCFVSLLSALALGRELSRLRTEIVFAILRFDAATGG